MGIRNLTKDLQQFLEPAVLDGTASTLTVNDDEVRISRIVIDGPSLVYHVFHGLLWQITTTEISSGLVPTYADVIRGVKSFLGEVRGRGVEM
jgi:hypothetical protein